MQAMSFFINENAFCCASSNRENAEIIQADSLEDQLL
jgi:hypothetical protein